MKVRRWLWPYERRSELAPVRGILQKFLVLGEGLREMRCPSSFARCWWTLEGLYLRQGEDACEDVSSSIACSAVLGATLLILTSRVVIFEVISQTRNTWYPRMPSG